MRHTWQLGPDKFWVTNGRNWDAALATIMPQLCARAGLGVDCSQVEAQRYKLLLYEQGSFFAPHQDTEKVRACKRCCRGLLCIKPCGWTWLLSNAASSCLVTMATRS